MVLPVVHWKWSYSYSLHTLFKGTVARENNVAPLFDIFKEIVFQFEVRFELSNFSNQKENLYIYEEKPFITFSTLNTKTTVHVED